MNETFKVGDRVRLIRLDGTLSKEAVVIHDLFGGSTSEDGARNASFMLAGGIEELWHTDLMKHETDDTPVVVPDGGDWYVARGDNMGWGRAQSVDAAIKNMKRQGGKVEGYVVHRVSKWTRVDGMGSLTYPKGIDPIEIKRVERKRKTNAA
jgi:hypothetical protein